MRRKTGSSSHRRCSLKKVILTNFAKFAGKQLCQALFLSKAAGTSPGYCFRTGFFLLSVFTFPDFKEHGIEEFIISSLVVTENTDLKL